MRAVVYSGYGITPALTEVADPVCPADGVVIAVGATGVCRSDWHAWQVEGRGSCASCGQPETVVRACAHEWRPARVR